MGTRKSRQADILLGLMSGTSADGIDVAAVRIHGHGLHMHPAYVDHLAHPFSAAFRKRLLAVMAPANTTTQEIARLHTDLGHAFADAAIEMIDRLGSRKRPVAIGLAGQTICHLPGQAFSIQRSALSLESAFRTPHPASNRPSSAILTQRKTQDASRKPQPPTITLQLGNPHVLAARTGIPVIADFRQSDVAAGGQGAPLVPWTDWVLFHGRRHACAVQNIGGIGNVTYIPVGGLPADVIAFDTGPGNMIIDALVSHITDGRQRMDRDGARARRGRVLLHVLARWMKHPFLQLPPPRTTGRETFGRVFVDRELPRLRRASPNPDDWVATATAFTAATIVDAYRRHLPRGTGILPVDSQTTDLFPSDKTTIKKVKDSRSFRTTLTAHLARDDLRENRPQAKKTVNQIGKSDSRNARGPGMESMEVILCGGGTRNPALRSQLASALPGARVSTIDEHGTPAEAKEALSFAILARAALDRVPANLPQATGATRPACLGLRVDPP